MSAVTSAIDASDASLRRRELAALGERLRQLPAQSAPPSSGAARSPTREARSEPPDYEVLDFRRHEDEESRYRRARDASAGPAEPYSRYAPDAEAARFVVEVRVAVAASTSAAQSAEAAPTESESASAPGPAAAAEPRNARAATAAYEAVADSRAPATERAIGTERALAAERERHDYEAARLATLRAQAANAYQAVGRLHERARVHVFA